MRINNYIESVSVKEAYEQLLEHPLNGILGGGTWLKLTNGKLETLIGLKDLGLDQITETSEELIIGSQTTLRAIETNDTARHLADGILADAASHIMGVTLRNLATIGGTVCGRYPFSDLLTVLLAMDAKLEFFNQKLILLSDYLNSKRPELDILLNVRIPKTNNRGYFKKISRTALDFAIVNLALVKQEEGYNIVIGARPNVAKKAIKAMGLLNASADITENDFDLIAKTAVDELNFSTNSKASADYRKDLARIYIKRGLKVVIGK